MTLRTLRACTGILSLLLAASRIAEAQRGNGSDVTGPPTTGSGVVGSPYINPPTALGPISTNVTASVTTGAGTGAGTGTGVRLNVPAALIPLAQQMASGNLVSPVTQQTIPKDVSNLVAVLGGARGNAAGVAAKTLTRDMLNAFTAQFKSSLGTGLSPNAANALMGPRVSQAASAILKLVNAFAGVLTNPTKSNVTGAVEQYNKVVTLAVQQAKFSSAQLPAPLQAMQAVLQSLIVTATRPPTTPTNTRSPSAPRGK